MLFRKTMRLTLNTTPLMLKSIIVQIIVIALVLGILMLVISPIVQQALDLAEQIDISAHLQDLIKTIAENPTSADVSGKSAVIIEDIFQLIEKAGNLFSSIGWAYFFIILAIVVYRFLLSIVDCSVMSSITDFMQTSSCHSYVWYFVKTFGRAVTFSILQFVVIIWLDMFVVFGAIGFYLFILSPLGAVGVILAVVMLVLAYSSRLTIYSSWLPEYVMSGDSVYVSLKNSVTTSVERFWKIWYKIVIVVAVMTILSILSSYLLNLIACPTFLSTLISATISFYGFYTVKCIGAVEYFEAKGKQYFTKRIKITSDSDIDTIIVE